MLQWQQLLSELQEEQRTPLKAVLCRKHLLIVPFQPVLARVQRLERVDAELMFPLTLVATPHAAATWLNWRPSS